MTFYRPNLSYTIWMTQRVGSTLLCQLLKSTGVAGNPGEWLNIPEDRSLMSYYGMDSPQRLQDHIWRLGTVSGVFGLKYGPFEPHFSDTLQTLASFPGCPQNASRAEVWANAFPDCRHIFLTRKNKVRLAVSWWKAIQTKEWHRLTGESHSNQTDAPEYSFEAIGRLYHECLERERVIQGFFAEAFISPITIVYEDLAASPEVTVRRILCFLDLDEDVRMGELEYERLSDDVSDQWVERFLQDKEIEELGA